MIKNSNFIQDHLTFKNKYGPPLLLLHCATRKRCDAFSNKLIKEEMAEFYSLHYDNHDFSKYYDVEVPIAVDNGMPCLHVVGTCNGLVCIADDLAVEANKFIICNPLIRKSVTLPVPNFRIENYDHTGSPLKYNVSIGFGYDAETNDYKVVRLVTLLNGASPTVAEVYSLATGSWSPRRRVNGVSEMEACTPQAFVNGILHWLAIYEAEDGNSYYFILTFDVHTESFSKLMMPEIVPSRASAKLQVSVSSDGKSIALFSRNFVDTVFDRFLDIWIMQEYGVHESWTIWTTLRAIGPSESRSLLPKALCFRVNGEIVSEIFDDNVCRWFWHLYCVGHRLYSIHPSGWWRNLEYSGFRYYTVNSYKESLVLLDMDNVVSY